MRKVLSVFIVLILLLSGCRQASQNEATPTPADLPTATLPVDDTAPVAALVLTDLGGNQVEVPSNPGSVISLSPAVTEIIYALGREDVLIGADTGSDYPEGAAALAKYSADDLNAIMEAKPQVLFVDADFPAAAKATLAEAGVTVVVGAARNYNDIFFSISFLANILGEDASTLILQMNEHVAAIYDSETEFEPVSVLLVLGGGTESEYHVAADGSLFNELIAMLGSSSATVGVSGGTMNADAISALDPQVVLVSSALDFQAITTAGPLASLSAVEAGRVFEIDEAGVYKQGNLNFVAGL